MGHLLPKHGAATDAANLKDFGWKVKMHTGQGSKKAQRSFVTDILEWLPIFVSDIARHAGQLAGCLN